MVGCEFCEIVNGDREAFILDEDEDTVTFLDQNPATQGHSLVVPRAHDEFLFVEDSAVSENVFLAVHRLSLALRRALDIDGVSLFYTSAELIGSVDHAHVHIVPRFVDDEIHLTLPRRRLDKHEASEFAEQVRAEL